MDFNFVCQAFVLSGERKGDSALPCGKARRIFSSVYFSSSPNIGLNMQKASFIVPALLHV